MNKLADNILCWCENPEEGAIQQAKNIAEHPCLIGNVCLMPDTHEGYGMPIGGVVALEDAVCPNMVGVDIGCGMLAVKTSYTEKPTPEQLKQILAKIRETVPVGFNHHKNPQDNPIFDDPRWAITYVCHEEKDSATRQLGTLGGGNHFIELQWGDDGHLWFMIHSGSRNLGKKVADYYNKKAKTLCQLWRQTTCVEHDLAFLPRGTVEHENYIDEMSLCVDFALANRHQIFQKIGFAVCDVLGDAVAFNFPINIAHNYAAYEHHYGKNVIVHRKGATLARTDTVGIIPGSQGTSSYIVEGLGDEASLCSCSHGAGRRMSRTRAKNELSLEEEIERMNEQGIVHGIIDVDDLDEAPSAYKDIDEVMEQQRDLVKIRTKLTPLAVVKG